MKQKKTIWRIVVMLAFLIAISCQQDTFEEEVIQEEFEIESSEASPFFTVDYRTKEDFENNTFLTKHVNEINQIRDINNNSETFGIVNSVDYGFSINTDRYQHISNEHFDSYTFNVVRDTPVEGILENYVLSQYSNGSYKQWLISYPRSLDFESGVDIANASIEVINDPNLITFSFNDTGECFPEIVYVDDAGGCIEVPCCGTDQHKPSSEDLDYCHFLNGVPLCRPRTECSGAWVEQPCNSTGGGPDGDGNPPGDDPGPGGPGSDSTGNGEEEEGGDNINDGPECIINEVTGQMECDTPIIPFSPLTLISILGITDQAQIDYLNDINNITIVREIFDFFIDEGQTDAAREVAIQILEMTMEDSQLNIEALIGIIDGLDNLCEANELLKSLRLDTNFMSSIRDALLTSTTDHINLQDISTGEGSPPMPDNSGARVQPYRGVDPETGGDVVILEFNNGHLNQATDLGFVNTFYHELLHAYTFHLYHEGILLDVFPQYTSLNNAMNAFFLDDTNQTLSDNMQKELHDIFIDFIDQIAESLVQYSTNNNIQGVDLEFARKLVWGGLSRTDIFENTLTPLEQTEAETLLGYENSNDTNNAKDTRSCN